MRKKVQYQLYIISIKLKILKKKKFLQLEKNYDVLTIQF